MYKARILQSNFIYSFLRDKYKNFKIFIIFLDYNPALFFYIVKGKVAVSAPKPPKVTDDSDSEDSFFLNMSTWEEKIEKFHGN